MNPIRLQLAVALFSLASAASAQRVTLAPAEDLEVRSLLHLQRYAAQRIDLPSSLSDGSRATLIVEFEDGEFALDLARRSVRSDDFALYAQSGGSREPLAPAAASTWRGDAFPITGGANRWRAAVTIEGGRLRAFLHSEAGEVRGIQSLADVVTGADPALHVAYRASDVVTHDGRCAVEAGGDALKLLPGKDPPGWLEAASLKRAEIAIEGDTFYFAAAGSSSIVAQNDVEMLINAMISIYEAEVGITYELTSLLLQTDGTEQYGGTSSGALLDKLRKYWNNHNGAISRDTAHLLTARNLNDNIIGIAYVGVICNLPFAYGVSETTFSGNVIDRVALTSHEVGHNWNADHCNGQGDCGIMCTVVGGCSGDQQHFGASEENAIESFRDSVSCLENASPPIEPPFRDPFESAKLDSKLWKTNQGASISEGAGGETSGKRAAKVDRSGDSADKLLSKTIDFEVMSGSAEVSFYVEHRGVESGESLDVEFKDAAGEWIGLTSIVSDGTKQSTFQHFVVALPPAALHAEGRIRFAAANDESNDDWFLDDVEVRAASAPSGASFCTSQLGPVVLTHVTGQPDPAAETDVIHCGDTGTLAWSAAEVADAPWLTVMPASGSLPPGNAALVQLLTTTAAASPGIQTTRVRVTQTNGDADDFYDVPVTLIESDVTMFDPGDTLTGAIDVAGAVDDARFVAIDGETVSIKLKSVSGGLKTTVKIFDVLDTLQGELTFGGSGGETKSVTLTGSGLFRVTVEGRSSTTGSYELKTSRELPASGMVQTLTLEPAVAGGAVEGAVLALPGARLHVTAAPKDEGLGPFTFAVTGPNAESLNIAPFVEPLPDGGVLLRDLPMIGPGNHVITVSGFTGTEKLRLTLDPQQPSPGATTRSID